MLAYLAGSGIVPRSVEGSPLGEAGGLEGHGAAQRHPRGTGESHRGGSVRSGRVLGFPERLKAQKQYQCFGLGMEFEMGEKMWLW